jgi:hypothetical protein
MEVNVSDNTNKLVSNKFKTSVFVSPQLGESRGGSEEGVRDLSFFEKVFAPAFQEVATMLVIPE